MGGNVNSQGNTGNYSILPDDINSSGWKKNTNGNNRNYSNNPGDKNDMGGNMNSQGNNENLSELPVDKNGMGGNDTTSMGNETNISPLFNTSGRPSVYFESNLTNHRGVDNSPAWMTR